MPQASPEAADCRSRASAAHRVKHQLTTGVGEAGCRPARQGETLQAQEQTTILKAGSAHITEQEQIELILAGVEVALHRQGH